MSDPSWIPISWTPNTPRDRRAINDNWVRILTLLGDYKGNLRSDLVSIHHPADFDKLQRERQGLPERSGMGQSIIKAHADFELLVSAEFLII
jgi:hypothetical protein